MDVMVKVKTIISEMVYDNRKWLEVPQCLMRGFRNNGV
jgi:hypothetical protein